MPYITKVIYIQEKQHSQNYHFFLKICEKIDFYLEMTCSPTMSGYMNKNINVSQKVSELKSNIDVSMINVRTSQQEAIKLSESYNQSSDLSGIRTGLH